MSKAGAAVSDEDRGLARLATGLAVAALLVGLTLIAVSAVVPLRHLAIRALAPGEGERLVLTAFLVGLGVLVGAFVVVADRVPPLAPALTAVLLVAALADPSLRPVTWLEGVLPGRAVTGLVSSIRAVLVTAGAFVVAAGVRSRSSRLLVDRVVETVRRIPLGRVGPGVSGGVLLAAVTAGGTLAGSRLLGWSMPPTWPTWGGMVAVHVLVGALAALGVLAAVRLPAAPLVAVLPLVVILVVPGLGDGAWQPTAVLVGILGIAAVRGLSRARAVGEA